MLEKYLAHLLVNNSVNPYFHIGLTLLQAVQMLMVLTNFQKISFLRNSFLLTFIDRTALGIVFITIQVIIIILLITGYYLFHKNEKKVLSEKSFWFVLVSKILNYSVLFFKTLLIIPLKFYVVSSLIEKLNNIIIILSTITLFIYWTCIIPTTFFGFWNKFCVNRQSLAYPYIINIVSWIQICSHFIAFLCAISKDLMPYFCGVMFLLSLPIIYFNSPHQFFISKVCDGSYSFMVSLLLVSFGTKILSIEVDSFQSFLLHVFLAFLTAFLVHSGQNKCIQRIFLSNLRQSKSLFNFIQNYNQVFVYHLLNYTQSLHRIFIYFVEHQSDCIDPQCLAKSIFDQFKQGQKPQNLFPKIKQFFLEEIQKQYHPKEFEGFGQTQIDKAIHEKGKLYLLIVQLILMKDDQYNVKENLRKAYSFLKQHEELVKRTTNEFGLMTRIEIAAILQIIEEELVLTVKRQSLTGHFDSKAFEYFQFQEKMERFKAQLSQICDLSLQFWTEMMYEEPDHKKIKDLIQMSQKSANKVQKTLKKLVSRYKRSCLVTYELIFQYSNYVLNCGITSSFNPFASMESKYKEELEAFTKENFDPQRMHFEQTSHTPVCIASLEKVNIGQIYWANTSFRLNMPIQNQNALQEKNKMNINDLIPPFLRQTHLQFSEDFSKQQNMLFDHKQVLLYSKGDKLDLIQPCQVEAQIYPTLNKGLKLLVFFKNVPLEKKEQSKIFIIDEHFETTLFTKGLAKEWQQIAATSDYDASPLQKYFKPNSVWNSLYKGQSIQGQIKLDMEASDYMAKFIKIVKSIQGKRYFYFEVFNLLVPNDFETPKHGDTLKTNQQTKSHIFEFLSNTGQSLKENTQHTANENNRVESRFGMTGTQHLTTEMKKIYEQKTEEETALQKIFQTIATPKTPKKIVAWRFLTVILMLFLVTGMASNIFITVYRKSVYSQVFQKVGSYNKMITCVTRILITLREYNYNAQQNISSPSLPYYKNQLQLEQAELSFLVQDLKQELTETWLAFEFLETGVMNQKKQIEFVVLANYILSSITYLSDQPYESLAFPFFDKDFQWYLGMTQSQSNYLNTIWNGMYVCLGNMLQKRDALKDSMQNDILGIDQQLYLFPALFGILVLVLFVVFSLCVENKSLNLIKEGCTLLEEVSVKRKKQKILRIKEFRDIFITNDCDKKSSNFVFDMKQSTFNDKTEKGQIAETNYEPDLISETRQKASEQNSKLFERTNQLSQHNQTDRQLASNLTDRQNPLDKQKMHSKSGHNLNLSSLINKDISKKAQRILKTCTGNQELKTKIDLRSDKRLIYLFYILVVIPFLAYFLSIFFSGISLNTKLWFYVDYSSQLYNLNTYQEYNYFLSQNMFYVQSPLLGFPAGTRYGDLVLPFVLKIYDSEHFIDDNFDLIDQTSVFAQTKNSLDSHSICNRMDLFTQKSVYYDINFEKSQCQSIAHHILTKGFKSAFVYLTETGVELINRNMQPQLLSREERIQYLDGPELSSMKKVLAYSEQIIRIQTTALMTHIGHIIENYIQIINILSILLIFSLILIIKATNYRWLKMKSQAKHVQSILRLISFKDIKKEKQLKEKFIAIDYKFYE